MLKKAVFCGAMVVLLAGAMPVSKAKAQSFVLDPNNTSGQSSRDAKPAYKGGVVVPYNPDSGRSNYNRRQARTSQQQQQQQTGPISYGAVRNRNGSTGDIYNGYNNPEGENARRVRTPDHEERLQAHRARQKARAEKREQEARARGAAQMEEMRRAKEEYEARNRGRE